MSIQKQKEDDAASLTKSRLSMEGSMKVPRGLDMATAVLCLKQVKLLPPNGDPYAVVGSGHSGVTECSCGTERKNQREDVVLGIVLVYLGIHYSRMTLPFTVTQSNYSPGK